MNLKWHSVSLAWHGLLVSLFEAKVHRICETAKLFIYFFTIFFTTLPLLSWTTMMYSPVSHKKGAEMLSAPIFIIPFVFYNDFAPPKRGIVPVIIFSLIRDGLYHGR